MTAPDSVSAYLPQAAFRCRPQALSVEDNIALVLEDPFGRLAARRKKTFRSDYRNFRLQAVAQVTGLANCPVASGRRCEIRDSTLRPAIPASQCSDEALRPALIRRTQKKSTILIRHLTDRGHRRGSIHRSQGTRTIADSSIRAYVIEGAGACFAEGGVDGTSSRTPKFRPRLSWGEAFRLLMGFIPRKWPPLAGPVQAFSAAGASRCLRQGRLLRGVFFPTCGGPQAFAHYHPNRGNLSLAEHFTWVVPGRRCGNEADSLRHLCWSWACSGTDIFDLAAGRSQFWWPCLCQHWLRMRENRELLVFCFASGLGPYQLSALILAVAFARADTLYSEAAGVIDPLSRYAQRSILFSTELSVPQKRRRQG